MSLDTVEYLLPHLSKMPKSYLSPSKDTETGKHQLWRHHMLKIIPLLVYSDFYFRFMQYLDVSLPSLSYELKQTIRKLLFLTIRVLAYVEKIEHISIRELLFLLECIICWDFQNFSTLLHYLMNSCRLQLSSSH